MMIAVHTIRAPSRTPPSDSSAMSIWTSYDAMIDSANAAAYKPMKRKRDSFEAYDFQVHKQPQRMRYSLLREDANQGTLLQERQDGVYHRDSLLSLTSRALSDKPRLVTPPPIESAQRVSTSKSHETRKVRRNKKVRKAKRGSPRMTKKHYNKKKRMEMMQATNRQIQSILGGSRLQIPAQAMQRVMYYRKKVEQLDLSLRDQCHSIVYKEQDIKSWLGMTTRSRSQIISLRKRLHDRWAEVKDLQSIVKPRRQRLKNLKFAALCEERSIAEEC
ncbi:expressed unknown protein [Seminavis robusta]|uniref:Uncharacterized protein n=1 Tax=Seminavis robusta TaxID=568900 RepID=A0A9N8DD73_9STRA|nr:expressed unknown protein [Seminavis robusta]|eukprot:Sro65_g036860.1 n/a (274) ;mRNA; r:100962-101783